MKFQYFIYYDTLEKKLLKKFTLLHYYNFKNFSKLIYNDSSKNNLDSNFIRLKNINLHLITFKKYFLLTISNFKSDILIKINLKKNPFHLILHFLIKLISSFNKNENLDYLKYFNFIIFINRFNQFNNFNVNKNFKILLLSVNLKIFRNTLLL